MKNDSRGMTMVEILVSFTVLAVVMLVFYSCIQFCGNMMSDAADIDRENNAFQSATAGYFGHEDGYELDHTAAADYKFKMTDSSGTVTEVTEHIPYAYVYFKYSEADEKYSYTTDSTGDVRKLVVFSTKD